MSKCPEFLFAAALAGLTFAPAAAEELGLGRPATEAEIAAWNIDIRPDGLGLPDGEGSVADGEEIFTDQCAMCHGDFGEGVGRWPVLAGGHDTLTRERPNKTIGSYWPYLSTVYDYVYRAMPFGNAQSLTPVETYALTAYLLYLNDVVTDEDFVLSRENFAEVRLPNEEGFVDDPRPDTATLADGTPCMENCKDAVEITMQAAVLDVTPDEGAPEGVSKDGSITEPDGSRPAEPVGDATPVGEQAGAEQPVAEPEAGAAAAAAEAVAGEDASTTETVSAAVQAHPGLIAAGEKVFRKCRACHQVGEGAKDRVGPQLNKIIGRAAGSVEGFRYSDAMIVKGAEGLVWTPEALDAYLADPKGYIPGTKMSFAGLRSPEDRAAVAAYLSQFH